jgi:hypothetical protein
MPIDLAQVDWFFVVVLALIVFVVSAIGNLLSFNHHGTAAGLSALAFAVIFIFWAYYPHGLPLPSTLTGQKTPATAVAPAAPAGPAKPRNPVTDITPPSNPVTTIPPPANSPR